MIVRQPRSLQLTMGLITDKFFWQALRDNNLVHALVGDRIANPALTYEQEDKWQLPYIVIGLEGVQNGTGSKDEVGEADEDSATVSVLCVAENRDRLATLTTKARAAIRDAYTTCDWDSIGFEIMDYQMSADGISLDPERPCCYQTLRYVCEVAMID